MTRAPRIWQNIVANYAGAAVAAILPILALPFYLHLLGPGEFGLIGFVMTLISLMWILDAGVSQALVPDIAQRLNGNETDKNSANFIERGFRANLLDFRGCHRCRHDACRHIDREILAAPSMARWGLSHRAS